MTQQRVDAPRFCYVVLCHRLPGQVEALVRRIRVLSPAAAVLVRHDRGPAFLDEAALRRVAGPDVAVLADTRPVVWGDWSMVAATETAFARARELFDPDWCVLLSGQDWPVRDLAAWEAELAASGADAVVRADPVDLTWSTGRRITEEDLFRARWTHRWWALPANPLLKRVPAGFRDRLAGRFSATLMWYQRPVMVRQLPRRLGWKLGLRRRGAGLPAGWQVRKGEQWVALDRRALDAVDEVTAADASIRRFFAGAHIPDESYFPTVLSAVPGLTVADGRVSWHRFDRPGAPSPAALGADDAAAALASGAPFARKVEPGPGDGFVAGVDAAVDAAVGAPADPGAAARDAAVVGPAAGPVGGGR